MATIPTPSPFLTHTKNMKKKVRLTISGILFIAWIALSSMNNICLAVVGVFALLAAVLLLVGTEYVGG